MKLPKTDYSVVMYYAKTWYEKTKDKDTILFHEVFKDATFDVFVIFEKKVSKYVYYDIEEVWEKYGKQFGSYDDFLNAFCKANTYYEIKEIDGDKFIGIDVVVCKIEDTISPALTSLTAITRDLNEMLGTDEYVYDEDDWREEWMKCMDKRKKLSLVGVACSVIVFILGIIGCVKLEADLLVGLSFFITPVAAIVAIVFGIRYKIYKNKVADIKRSLG